MLGMGGCEEKIARLHFRHPAFHAVVPAAGCHDVELVALMRRLRTVGRWLREADLQIAVLEYVGRAPSRGLRQHGQRRGERNCRRSAIHYAAFVRTLRISDSTSEAASGMFVPGP